MTKKFLLETNRCYLRPFSSDKKDLDLIYNLRQDKDVCLSMEKDPISKEKAAEMHMRYLDLFKRFGFSCFAVFHKETDEFIGSCGFTLFYDPDHNRNPLPAINNDKYDHRDLEIGYGLHKKFWGTGIANELVDACIKDIESRFPDIERMVAVTVFSNIKSQKILLKNGFNYFTDIDSQEFGKQKFFVKSLSLNNLPLCLD